MCSKSCRSQGVSKIDKAIEQSIIQQLSTAIGLGQKNAAGLPIDAIAQVIWPSNWAAHMPRLHDACRRLAHQRVIDIFDGSKKIDPSDLKGKVLLKLSSPQAD